MSDPRDYKLDLSGAAGEGPTHAGSTAAEAAAPASLASSRPYLSVLFACCGVYQRVYRSPDGRNYHGRCPRCGVPVRFAVGEGGTGARSFVVR